MSKLFKSSGYHLWIATQTRQRLFNQCLKSYELTHAQYFVLSYMIDCDENNSLQELSQNQLAQELSLNAMMVSNILKALETKGLVTKSLNKTESSSSSLLGITKEAKICIDKLRKEIKQFEKKLFAKTDKKFVKSLESITRKASKYEKE